MSFPYRAATPHWPQTVNRGVATSGEVPTRTDSVISSSRGSSAGMPKPGMVETKIGAQCLGQAKY